VARTAFDPARSNSKLASADAWRFIVVSTQCAPNAFDPMPAALDWCDAAYNCTSRVYLEERVMSLRAAFAAARVAPQPAALRATSAGGQEP